MQSPRVTENAKLGPKYAVQRRAFAHGTRGAKGATGVRRGASGVMSGAMIDGDVGVSFAGVCGGATPTGGSQASGTSGTALSRHVGWSRTKPGLMGWGTRHTMVGATSCAGFVAAACAADSIAIAAGCVRRCLRVFF